LYNMADGGSAEADVLAEAVTDPRRVLLVEEESTFRAQLVETLTAEGYQVECAGDGSSALAWLAREPPPDAIVIDMVLPRVDAVAFRRMQLQSPELRRVPTIALSPVRPLAGPADVTFQAVVSKAAALDRLVDALALLYARDPSG
jgi:two-component system, chemotaxis family, chemotaxis protein CheY